MKIKFKKYWRKTSFKKIEDGNEPYWEDPEVKVTESFKPILN